MVSGIISYQYKHKGHLGPLYNVNRIISIIGAKKKNILLVF